MKIHLPPVVFVNIHKIVISKIYPNYLYNVIPADVKVRFSICLKLFVCFNLILFLFMITVHPSCIEMPHRMATRVRNYNWQCADCKCCIKCKRKQDQNKMLFCEQCDRGFHIYCLAMKAVPDGKFKNNLFVLFLEK